MYHIYHSIRWTTCFQKSIIKVRQVYICRMLAYLVGHIEFFYFPVPRFVLFFRKKPLDFPYRKKSRSHAPHFPETRGMGIQKFSICPNGLFFRRKRKKPRAVAYRKIAYAPCATRRGRENQFFCI